MKFMALVLKEMMKKEKYYAWIRSINQWSSERSELGATTPLSLTAGGTRVSAFGATTPTVWNTAWRGTKRTKRFPRKTRAKANVGKADRASWQVTDQGRAKRSLGKRSVPRRDAADGGRSLPLAAQEARLPYTNTDRKSRMVRNRGLTKKRPSPPPPTFLGRK